MKKAILFTLLFVHFFSVFSFSFEEQEKFDSLYQSWLTSWEKVKFSSSSYDYVNLEEFQSIIEMGIPVLPRIIEKIDVKVSLEALCLMTAVEEILMMRLERPENELKADTERNMVIEWWEEGRFKTRERFIKLHQQWSQLSRSEKMKRPFTFDWDKEYKNNREARRAARKQWMQMPEGPEKERMRPYNRTVYQRVLDLGIPALPYAIEKITTGDRDLVEAINYWTDSSLDRYTAQRNVELKSASRAELSTVVNQWWSENKDKYTLPL